MFLVKDISCLCVYIQVNDYSSRLYLQPSEPFCRCNGPTAVWYGKKSCLMLTVRAAYENATAAVNLATKKSFRHQPDYQTVDQPTDWSTYQPTKKASDRPMNQSISKKKKKSQKKKKKKTKSRLCTFLVTVPCIFSISPSMAASKDDLPHPTGPTTATSCPWGMWTLILGERDKIQQAIWFWNKKVQQTIK